MANAQSEAAVTALKLITTGLQSGSIKLHGVTNPANATSAALADATYLKKLLTDLTAAIQAQD